MAALISGAALAQTAPETPAAPTAPAPAPAAPAPTTPEAPAAEASVEVATVNRQPITLADFEREYRVFAAGVLNRQGMPFSEEALALFAQYRPQVLDQLVREEVVRQAAAAAGIRADDAKVDAEVTEVKSGFPNEEAFQQALEASGIEDEAAYRRLVASGQVSDAYIGQLQSKFRYSDAVVSSYYQTNKERFKVPGQACVKHILVASAPEAQAARNRLNKGEDFAAVAKAVSIDPGSKDEGGDLGCFAPGDTVEAFDRAAFNGPLNTLQQVKTEFGEHLLIVEKRTPTTYTPLTEVADRIRGVLADESARKFIENLVKRADVKTYPERLSSAPATPAQTPPPSGN
ncbi:peptidyl-prolyl cis-trans isomerase C [Deinobacterium chartae]|uniref:Peptidyl-prolyl cis-trans isomerase C n=1 Tax=Deinobacterium chartae TaxID=521158 RepID=A0A841HVJ2_9DEIO|nr:peptidylprolyl isomerase [Deinobacterium chartae]MBB6097521.1 peptidyl-prolyl cis-trans isomerase C [Deinobacterium chartae]